MSIEKALVQNFQNDSAVNKDNATTIYLSLAREMYSLHEDIRAEFEKIESVFNQTSQQDPQVRTTEIYNYKQMQEYVVKESSSRIIGLIQTRKRNFSLR